MPLTQAEIDEFNRKGFLIGPRVLDDGAVARMREEIQAWRADLAARGVDNDPELIHTINIWAARDTFFEAARHPEITACVAQLCGDTDTLRIWHDQLHYKLARTERLLPWHQDYLYWTSLVPSDFVTAWIALDDADEENGCMWMVPGSHRLGPAALKTGSDFELVLDPDLALSDIPDRTAAFRRSLPPPEPIRVPKGGVAFHHCMTWHGSPRNASDRPRRAYTIHYMPGHIIYRPETAAPVTRWSIPVAPGERVQGPQFPVVYRRA